MSMYNCRWTRTWSLVGQELGPIADKAPFVVLKRVYTKLLTDPQIGNSTMFLSNIGKGTKFLS